MNRIKNMLLITIFMLLVSFSLNVKAEEFKYYLSNSEQNYDYVDKNSVKTISVKRGDTIVVTAVLNNKDNASGYKLSAGNLTIRWDDKVFSLENVNGKAYDDTVTDVSGLTIGSVEKVSTRVTLSNITSTGTLKEGKNKIVAFKFVVLDNAEAITSKIYQMDGEASLTCLNTNPSEEEMATSIKCGDSLLSELKYSVSKSTINTLTAIKIDGQEIDNFKEDTNGYDITVGSSVTKIKIETTKKDSRSTVSGDGEKQVQYGANKYTITVTSESGTKNTYTINVNRPDNRSSVNTLKTLTITPGEITFSPTVTEYTVNVDNEVEKVTITSSLTDAKSKYVTDFSNKEVALIEGSNKIEIKVLSEREEEKTYTINVNRALSSNNSLKILKVNDEKVELIENEFTYNVTVENDVDEVTIVATPVSDKATVKLDESYPLEIGENEIIIKIKAASGEEASYTLNVTRKKILSKDSLLVSLKIEGYDIGFDPEVTLYNLKIEDDVEELKITTTPKDPEATVEIEGNKDLENGSIVKVNVKAEDGSFTRYFINIEKGSKGISPVIIIILVLLLLLAGCIGLIIYRKKKQEKKALDKLDEKEEVVKTDDTPIEKQEEPVIPTEETPNEVSEEVATPSDEAPADEEYDENYVGTHLSEEDKELVEEEIEKEKDE